MIKRRLYENEDELSRIVDTKLYDAIFLENRPIDMTENRKYLAILTKIKQPSARERAGEWILKIFMQGTSGKWQLTPGQWYLKTLLGYDEYNQSDFLDEDIISIDGTPNWKIAGMIDIIAESVEKTDTDSEEIKGLRDMGDPDELSGYKPMKKEEENKIKDYSKMKKWELEKLVDQALDSKDYALLDKIYKYLPESVLVKIPFMQKHTLNEKFAEGEKVAERSIDLRGPEGNAFAILGMAKQLTKQLKEIDSEMYDWQKIQSEMMTGDYKNLVLTFEKYFGDYVTIYNADVLDESLNESFSSWYSENKESETLWDEYADYTSETPKIDRLSFREWCKEKYEWIKEYEGVDESLSEGIKHLKPRSKSEILRNMKNDPDLKKDDEENEEIDESANEEKPKKQILMGHNSPNPDDPEVNGLAYRIESEEDIKDKIGESANHEYLMPRLFEKYFTDEDQPPIEDKEKEAEEKESEEKELKKYKTTDESVDPFVMPSLLEDRITKSYEEPLTREDVRKMVGKMLIAYQKSSKYENITSMADWLRKNNLGDYQYNRWVRAVVDTLFKKVAGTWTPINTNLSIDQLTDKVMDFWKNKMKKESLDEAGNNWYFKPSPLQMSDALRQKRQFLKIHPDAKISIDARKGFVVVNDIIAYDISSIIGNKVTPERAQEQMERAYRESKGLDEGCGCGPKKKPTGKFTPAPKRPPVIRPRSK